MSRQNRLADEKSPYLLQHANNPVDWYPWSEEAFKKAKDEDKPVFLSIGYSTCHWCHVMENESFEDEKVASLMNEVFVSIKVDREERPDIDGIYMTVCQMLTGSGGWPLTIIMTPDKKPFFAGTYFPKDDRFGRSGLLEIIPRIKEIWKTRRDEINKSADEISNAVKTASSASYSSQLKEEIFIKAFGELKQRFDSIHGGFGKSPKFPSPHNLLFLLRYWKRTNEPDALHIVEKTLFEIFNGGIYDHIGYGIHRYSTDQKWLVPHFEKMLYDQALLVTALVETYQAVHINIYKKYAEEIIEYVLRDMTSPDGAFYSAEDADSEGTEGKFYLWTQKEIIDVLGEDMGNLFCKHFNVANAGNWIDPRHGRLNGTNILFEKKLLPELSAEMGIKEEELLNKINQGRKKLFEHREKKIHPYKDDKILTDWNSLMISALSKAAQVFDNEEYKIAAENSVNFILTNLVDENGRLLHRYRNSEAGLTANVDDYAFFIGCLLDLYETTFNVNYLEKAIELNDDFIKYFWDYKSGGFFFTPNDGEELLIRQKEIYDGAVPSGNSVAISNLLRISRLTGSTKLEEMVSEMGKVFASKISQSPSAYPQALTGFDFAFGPSFEIVLTGEEDKADAKELLSIIRKEFIPNKVVVFRPANNHEKIINIAGFTQEQSPIDNKATVYVCQNFKCSMPVTSSEKLMKLLY